MNGLNGDLPSTDNKTNEQTTELTNDYNNETNLTLNDNSLKSSVLIVNNLVRPFTLAGLKKVLSKYGKIDKFWLSKDKSKCYLLYENEQIADESREYINSLKWPASNPNTLESTFGSLEELDELIKKDEEERIQLERERKEAAELEAAKQEERKQQLKEELSKKFSETLTDSNTELNGSNVGTDSLNNSRLNRSLSKDETNEEHASREVSPAKNPPTNVLHITNLVRPFSLNQLKELLNKHSQIIEEKFWIDRIKSRCYAVYQSNDDALTARNYIHGLRWPKTNTKTLRAEFGKLSEVNEVLNCDLDKLKIKDNDKSFNNSSGNTDLKPKDDKLEERSNDKLISDDKNEKSKEAEFNDHQISNKSEELKENVTENIIPARNPPSNIVFVKNLSRPFTQTQLKELLSRDGKYDEDKFWINKIKSQVYVCYENEEIAIKTRDRLHNLTWPTGNQKKLIADFATEAELENCLNSSALKKVAVEIHAKDASKDQDYHHSNRDKRRGKLNDSYETSNKTSKNEEYEEEMELDRVINEHEINNSSKRRRELSQSPVKNRRDHREERMRSLSPKEQRPKNDHVKESPVNLLDDLFKKTKTVPSIYWMPLNESEMKLRDEKRERERITREERERRQREDAERFKSHSFNQYNGRQRSPQRRSPIPYSRQAVPFRNYPSERDRYHPMPDKRPSFRPDRDRSLERHRSLERKYHQRSPIMDRLPPQRSDKIDHYQYADRRRTPPERVHYQHDRPQMRSPQMRTPPVSRTPDKHFQEKERRRTPVENKERNSRSLSESSSGSESRSSSSSSSSYYRGSRSPSNSKQPVKKRQTSHSRDSRSPKRMVRSPRSPPPARSSRSPRRDRRMVAKR